jgi:hypothetical protein
LSRERDRRRFRQRRHGRRQRATITGGQSGNFGTVGPYCFRTPDNIAGWGCSNFGGRTLQVNDVTKSCGSLPLPTTFNGYYYFEASAGSFDYASIYWWQ